MGSYRQVAPVAAPPQNDAFEVIECFVPQILVQTVEVCVWVSPDAEYIDDNLVEMVEVVEKVELHLQNVLHYVVQVGLVKECIGSD
jgi:hypothetical protein